MSDGPKCLDEDTTTGRPCQNPVGEEAEKCHIHGPEGDTRENPGRDTKYTPELANRILKLIAAGETLQAICERDDVPVAPPTIVGWSIDDRDGFAERYERARRIQTDVLFDRHLEVAKGDNGEGDSHVSIQRDKLVADAFKFRISKVRPEKYGRRVQHRHGGIQDGPPVEVNILDNDRELDHEGDA